MVIAIVAVDENWGIGNKNQLLFKIPKDLKRFKELTTDNVVIMGKNTFLSLGSKPLPHRTNIVITHEYTNPVRDDNDVIYSNMYHVKQYINNVKRISHIHQQHLYIIGGESIYKQLLPLCDLAYVTYLHDTFEADTHFPALNTMPDWAENLVKLEKDYYNGKQVDFKVFRRIKNATL